MLGTIKNSWKAPELRKKILYTVLIIIVFRIGSLIPVPFLDLNSLSMMMEGLSKESGGAFNFLDTFSGGAFSQGTLFAMSVSPYINASIIIQLMTVVLPALERLQKEGEDGRKKMGAITRYLTVVLGVAQAAGYYFFFLRRSGVGGMPIKYMYGFEGIFAGIVVILTFTAGIALMMWLGEQVNKKGIGNGISILLFAGIVSRMPQLIGQMYSAIKQAMDSPNQYFKNYFYVPGFVLLFFFLVWFIVFMNDAERRIPVQYAKRVSGRKMYAGQNSYIPVKVGLTGVMPVIFASTILSMPGIIAMFIHPEDGTWFKSLLDSLAQDGWIYAVLYFIFIFLFAYFYVSIQYNPIEISNNLKQSNGAIPGIRPGKPTSNYISRIFTKITFIGSIFLSIIAMLPMGFSALSQLKSLSLGGTSIIILVGVALETVKQMESQIMQKHYKGFLE